MQIKVMDVDNIEGRRLTLPDGFLGFVVELDDGQMFHVTSEHDRLSIRTWLGAPSLLIEPIASNAIKVRQASC